jgi:hypothetical protein
MVKPVFIPRLPFRCNTPDKVPYGFPLLITLQAEGFSIRQKQWKIMIISGCEISMFSVLFFVSIQWGFFRAIRALRGFLQHNAKSILRPGKYLNLDGYQRSRVQR